jgi:hypothetical protein
LATTKHLLKSLYHPTVLAACTAIDENLDDFDIHKLRA